MSKSDLFQPVSTETLCAWIAGERARRGSLLGVPRSEVFTPRPDDPFRTEVYGQALDTPFGVAAGPHTQMAQNIVAAWLCGARFIELKTVQTLDELEVAKPCIDMQDAGYNVEWSQELKIEQSITEYVRAWVLIHALHRALGFPGDRPGVVFNLSVGYNLEGIHRPNVQAFLDAMTDAGDRIRAECEVVARTLPEVRAIDIPVRLSDNVTLSTMHGCPPGEIGAISRYLISERRLHTSVKLNPTLLGPHRLRELLNQRLGYRDITVPDLAFEHDLKFHDALALIEDLRRAADRAGVAFGVKLSNTLEVVNPGRVFDPKDPMMYLSGRPLHALTVNLAATLDEAVGGGLPMSFAGGADAFNMVPLLAAGMKTVTVCSDLLRPGGYARMLQYITVTRAALAEVGAPSLARLACLTAQRDTPMAVAWCAEDAGHPTCPRLNLKAYAAAVLDDPAYHRDHVDRRRTKTARPLGAFDCIQAPCTDECPINQKVPEYMTLVREGRWAEAAAVTRLDNPLPAILGRACNHLCESVCLRTHLDAPLAIREIKRAIMDRETAHGLVAPPVTRPERIAVIGAGPCGLSVAYFLSLAGYAVELFEARPYAGGMVSGTIPGYRAAMDKVRLDMDLVLSLGAVVHYNQQAGRDFTLADLRARGFASVVVAAGAQRGGALGIEGEEAEGVFEALDFLRRSRELNPPALGQDVVVIGGGDVAMDCARTARRLGATRTMILYRRTRDEMPASRDELQELLDEAIPIHELAAPKKLVVTGGRVTAIACSRMRLGEPDASGRRRPVEEPGGDFELPVDQVVVAVNQQADLSFFGDERPECTKNGFLAVDPATRLTSLPGVYAGGDIGPGGPASIVKALGDGRAIARAIRRACESGDPAAPVNRHGTAPLDPATLADLFRRRATRVPRVPVPQRDPAARIDFDEVIQPLSDEAARTEAARCLDCHKLCSTCVGVCPNLALFTYANPSATESPVARQAYQVAVFHDFCNACGNCATFCPTAGKPYRDKPRLFRDAACFAAETANAYRVRRRGERWFIDARHAGATLTLEHGADAPAGAPYDGMRVLLHAFRDEMPYHPAVVEEPA